jgi:hypothetical protein
VIALSDAAVRELERAAVRSGDFRPLMTRTQRQAKALQRRQRWVMFFLDCSRRWGKTRWLVADATECAMQHAGCIVRYGAPTKLHGRTFVMPAMQWLMAQLPPEQRCKFDREDSCWIFPNASRIYLGSCETIADCDAQVGTDCKRAISDEGAKVRSECLEYWHKTVILPQFATTNGTLVVGSTPALSPTHYLSTMRQRAIESGGYVRFTVDDCDHISAEMREEMIAEGGGPNAPSVRRELYCEHIPDRDWMVIPEWLDVRDECSREEPSADYRDWYASGDFGFEDLSVVLYAWFDFDNQRIVVEHEVAMHRASSLEVGMACKALEAEHGLSNVTRVADAPLQMLADLSHRTLGPGLDFAPAMKDDADASLAQLRSEVGRKRIVVNPRCRVLLSHLSGAIWNKTRTSFDRGGDEYGHWDAIDALKYLNRAVERRKNPAPILRPRQTTLSHHIPPHLMNQRRKTWTIGRDS